jgi:hypothetical protein
MYIEGEIPAVSTGTNNGGFFGGSDGIWAILLFAMIFGWGNGGAYGGFGGGNNMLYDINANTNRGFDNLAINSGIDSLAASIAALSSGLQTCCCENRLATSDLKYTIATENCADRQALSEGVRDIIASNTANTQAILDKLCQQEIDAKNDLIAQLRSQLSMADLRASQVAQTASIKEGQVAEIDALYNRLSSCPVPSMPVYGRTPIFTCSGSCGSVQ